MIRLFRRSEPQDDATRIVQYRYDRVLLGVTLVLMGIGVVMVYSASIVSAEARTGDGAYYLERQAAFCTLGLGLLVGTNFAAASGFLGNVGALVLSLAGATAKAFLLYGKTGART